MPARLPPTPRLARSIRSDPDLEASEPVAVRVGGIQALRMDVVTATGASVCQVEETPRVVTETGLDRGYRMRLYLQAARSSCGPEEDISVHRHVQYWTIPNVGPAGVRCSQTFANRLQRPLRRP
jgi:hypothetical protein